MLAKLDNWLLDNVFQEITDRFWLKYDRGPLWIASTCVLFVLALSLLKSWLKSEFPDIAEFIMVIYIVVTYDHEDWRRRRLNRGTMNSRRIDKYHKFFRLFSIVIPSLALVFFLREIIVEGISALASVEAVDICLTLEWIFICSALYFSACNTPPPGFKPKEKPVKVSIRVPSKATS